MPAIPQGYDMLGDDRAASFRDRWFMAACGCRYCDPLAAFDSYRTIPGFVETARKSSPNPRKPWLIKAKICAADHISDRKTGAGLRQDFRASEQ
jgi:hypothetical protein